MQRHEWMQRRTEFAKRGSALPQSKLTEQAVADIKSAIRQREALRKHLRDNLSSKDGGTWLHPRLAVAFARCA